MCLSVVVALVRAALCIHLKLAAFANDIIENEGLA